MIMENNKRLTFKNLFFAGLLGFTIAVCVCIPITKSIKMSSEPEPKITINIANMKS